MNSGRPLLVLFTALGLVAGAVAGSLADPVQPAPPSSVSAAYPAVADSELASIFAGWKDRDSRVQPGKVMAALSLQPGQVVADLGAGHGYFTYRLARAVAPSGKVLALDISEDYLAINQRVAGVFGVTNIENRVIPLDDPQLEPGEADVVFISYTWQFLDDRIRYATLLREALDNNGLLVVLGLEIPGISHENPERTYRWTNRQEVWREAEAAGFQLSADNDSLQNQYYLFFRPGRSSVHNQVPGFTCLTSNLAIGDAGPDSAGCEALRARGFRQVLDVRLELPDPSPARFGNLKQVRLSPDQPAAGDSLVSLLKDMDFGITYAFGDSLPQVATFILSACEAGLLEMSPFERDHLVTVSHSNRK